ncbi:MAG: DNA/RNA non-specific endonuclease [Eubacterium sp.]|nr:DNA/RNA non-specific endonuclease [Eubacterium sp.]
MKAKLKITALLLMICLMLSACNITLSFGGGDDTTKSATTQKHEYNSAAYTEINDNVPEFTEDEITTDSFEEYGRLDSLGRCTACTACVGSDLMPTEKRGSIGMIKPTGWHTVKYEGIDGNYLYNRCHLIGYQLTAENANQRNLITGTRYMNTEGMLPFENEVADYVKSTDGHVMYRVTPDFQNNELVARGVHMEAYSVEDGGKSVSFNVYCYNVQPGIEIDYKTGDSRLKKGSDTTSSSDTKIGEYILNTNSKRFHLPDCPSAKDIKDENKKTYSGSRSELISKGYSPCGYCKP